MFQVISSIIDIGFLLLCSALSNETGLTTAAILIAYELLIHIKVYLCDTFSH